MELFSQESFDTLGYYVYRLIDPRDNKTFYVGRGQKNRVFAHVREELTFTNNVDDENSEDELSAKIQTIRDIHKAGFEVKHVIHRYGMSEPEAREVESALIDVYRELGELTNIQSGYNPDRGLIETNTLIKNLRVSEYDEPDDINYLIIKTTNQVIERNGNLYEATRKAWRLNLDNAKKIKYVLASIDGIVKEVYEVDDWYHSEERDRVEFHGHVAPDPILSLFKDKKLPSVYRRKGLAYPVLYKVQNKNNQIQNSCSKEYIEPRDINYVIIKTKNTTVQRCNNSLYEASRKSWSLNLNRVRKIKYVLSTIDGIVKEVYKVDHWDHSPEAGKVEFTGKVAEDDVRNRFINKHLPKVYRKRGNASGALYKK